ncbi:hypothetical protein [Sulfurimonas sp.]|nr:hypothetical protein [Sulfurimonas sp.]
MQVHRLGLIEYEKARKVMQEIHSQALQDGQNHLIRLNEKIWGLKSA